MGLVRPTTLLFVVLRALLVLPWQAAAQSCQGQLLEVDQAKGTDNIKFVDEATPNAACTKVVASGRGSGGGSETLQLVFSDEFNSDKDREFSASAEDLLWTAEDMHYMPSGERTNYKPEQVTVKGGAALLEITPVNNVADSQQADGSVARDVARGFASGFLTSWNKFCFTGGYLEASIWLPGDDVASGFGPAFQAMGNLGRAGYLDSTAGMWPYSYNTCDPTIQQQQQEQQPQQGTPSRQQGQQLFDACPGDAPGIDRTEFELIPLQGRGAPQFDVFTLSMTPGGIEPPMAVQALQMAPLLPNNTNWWEGEAKGGLLFQGSEGGYNTQRNPQVGPFQRPGSERHDSLSALSQLGSTHFESYHTYAVDWVPGEYLRWYIDDELLFEVNKQALVAQKNASGAGVGPRLIPVEPMYLMLSLGLSDTYGMVEFDKLQFPAHMKVDWVRVYQRRDAINVGCSPKDYPTEKYLACNRDKYIIKSADSALIQGGCTSSALVASAPAQALLGSVVAAVGMLLLLLA